MCEFGRERSFNRSIDDAGNAVPHQRFAEIQKEPEFHVGQFQIGEDLFLMCSADTLHRFQFQNDFIVHNQVSPETLIEADALELNWNRYLPFDLGSFSGSKTYKTLSPGTQTIGS